LNITPIINKAKYDLLSANGTDIKIISQVEVQIYLKGLKFYQHVGTAKELNPQFLLRVDFLSANEARICYKTDTLSLLEDLNQITMYSMCDEANCMSLARTECIQPFSEATISVIGHKHLNNKSVMLEESQHAKRCPIAVANALTLVKNNKAVCQIMNMNPYVVTLKKGLK